MIGFVEVMRSMRISYPTYLCTNDQDLGYGQIKQNVFIKKQTLCDNPLENLVYTAIPHDFF